MTQSLPFTFSQFIRSVILYRSLHECESVPSAELEQRTGQAEIIDRMFMVALIDAYAVKALTHASLHVFFISLSTGVPQIKCLRQKVIRAYKDPVVVAHFWETGYGHGTVGAWWGGYERCGDSRGKRGGGRAQTR